MSEDNKITAEVPALTDAQLREATIGSLREAEISLSRLGDSLHEQRRQVAAIRMRLEAIS